METPLSFSPLRSGYSEESGWVTVSFEVSEDSWNRLDLTFSAGGAGAEFIGDGSHYTDLYVY